LAAVIFGSFFAAGVVTVDVAATCGGAGGTVEVAVELVDDDELGFWVPMGVFSSILHLPTRDSGTWYSPLFH
jgi:hypothetical protein